MNFCLTHFMYLETISELEYTDFTGIYKHSSKVKKEYG